MADASPEAVYEQLVRARITMLLQQPFWGTLATRLILKDATDDPDGWCPTAATDGRYMYYNRNFISKLDRQETIFLVAHEVNHTIYDHMGRRGGRMPKLWNAAADYVINYELHENKVGAMPSKASCVQGCFDEKYKGMFTEEVYEILLQDPDKKFPEFDVHMEPGDGKGEEMSEEERRILGDEIRNAVIQAAKAAGAGNVPNGVKRMLKDLTEPQMDWREHLNLTLQSMVKADFTWDRCSRKMQSSGIYLPATKNDFKVEAAVAIDCSGSMSEGMLRDLLGEVKGIMTQFADFKLNVWCFDTSVYSYQEFTPDTIDDIDEYDIKGGGGTDFMCNWEFMKEHDMVPERFLMFTDGYPCSSSWGDPDYCSTLFIIHGDPGHKLVAPFGQTAWYTPGDQ